MLILVTSAEIELMKSIRTGEYLKTIHWLKENVSHYEIVYLESYIKQNSYIERYFPVYYSMCHNANYKNKGANLGQALKKFFQIYTPKQDLIVQITGRYYFTDTYFFDKINENPGYDFYGKYMGENNFFTGAFAMRKKYLIDWVNRTNWDDLNRYMINFETSIKNYIDQNNLTIYNYDTIHMNCNIFGEGNPQRGYV